MFVARDYSNCKEQKIKNQQESEQTTQYTSTNITEYRYKIQV